MNTIIAAKSDLRRGKFKKILLPASELPAEAPRAHEILKILHSDYEAGRLSECEFGALWAISYLRIRHPFGWWGAHRKDFVHDHKFTKSLLDYPYFDWTTKERELFDTYQSLGSFLNHRALRATPLPVHRALLAWSNGDYPLVLMDRIPSVSEVLEQQIQGRRCVTLFYQLSRLSQLVLGERDPLGFGFHDLIHADHFFHANSNRQGQIGFYRIVHKLFHADYLAKWLAVEGFEGRLEYLMADMNSHPLHLWKCFRAICDVTLRLETQELFGEILPKILDLEESEAQSLSLLNQTDFQTEVHGVIITEMSENYAR